MQGTPAPRARTLACGAVAECLGAGQVLWYAAEEVAHGIMESLLAGGGGREGCCTWLAACGVACGGCGKMCGKAALGVVEATALLDRGPGRHTPVCVANQIKPPCAQPLHRCSGPGRPRFIEEHAAAHDARAQCQSVHVRSPQSTPAVHAARHCSIRTCAAVYACLHICHTPQSMHARMAKPTSMTQSTQPGTAKPPIPQQQVCQPRPAPPTHPPQTRAHVALTRGGPRAPPLRSLVRLHFLHCGSSAYYFLELPAYPKPRRPPVHPPDGQRACAACLQRSLPAALPPCSRSPSELACCVGLKPVV
jgi:hypothetical protein